MNRRNFIKQGLMATGAAALAAPTGVLGRDAAPAAYDEPAFTLKYAPHFGQFAAHAGDDPIDQLRFMAEQGFRALEDNGMRGRPVRLQERIGAELERLGMQMGVFAAHDISWREPTPTSGDPDARAAFLEDIRESIEVAERVGATWMTVVPGHVDPRLDMEYQTAYVIEALQEAAALLEPHGLVMVLEPLNTRRDHPGMFLTHTAQAYAICKAVNSPACKILYDMYHQQVTEGNIISNFDLARDEIAYLQIGDHPGRNEPSSGEINYKNVFRHIYEQGFDGILGMEHGQSRPGKEGERAVIEAYRAWDPEAL